MRGIDEVFIQILASLREYLIETKLCIYSFLRLYSIMKFMDGQKKQSRRSKIRGYLHDLGKLFIDVAKLAFGSLVLGSVIRWDIPHTTIFILGIIFSTIVAIGGILLARTYEEK